MSCGRFTRTAILEHLLSRPERSSPEMEEHVKLCEQCRRDAAALDRLTRMFDALRAQTQLKPPDEFFAAVLQECRGILPKVASERRPAIRTAAAHGVGTRLFAAVEVEKKKTPVLPIVAASVLVATLVGAAVGAVKAGLVARALAFAEPGGWTSVEDLSRELSEADPTQLRARAGGLWQVITDELYWSDVDVERLCAYDLARHIALRQDVREPARLCAELVGYSSVRRPEKIGSEDLKLAREWAEAVLVGDARAARAPVKGRSSRLMRWLAASSLLELGEEEGALEAFRELEGFTPADVAIVYLARKLGDEAGAEEAYERISEARLKSALSRR